MCRSASAEGNGAEIRADHVACIYCAKDVLKIHKTAGSKVHSADEELNRPAFWPPIPDATIRSVAAGSRWLPVGF